MYITHPTDEGCLPILLLFILESCTLVSIRQKTVLKIEQFFSESNKSGLLHRHEKNLWPSLIAEKMRYLGNASENFLYSS
jgi:hypothetical protein